MRVVQIKPINGTASKYGHLLVIMSLCARHASSQPRAVQQNKNNVTLLKSELQVQKTIQTETPTQAYSRTLTSPSKPSSKNFVVPSRERSWCPCEGHFHAAGQCPSHMALLHPPQIRSTENQRKQANTYTLGELHTKETESPATTKVHADQIGKGLGARGHVK
jgi:hypothetical protein